MGRVLHLGSSWHGPSFMWAELAWVELVLGRAVLHPLRWDIMTEKSGLCHLRGMHYSKHLH